MLCSGFARKFSFCPKNNGFDRVWPAAAPPAPLARTPMYGSARKTTQIAARKLHIKSKEKEKTTEASVCESAIVLMLKTY